MTSIRMHAGLGDPGAATTPAAVDHGPRVTARWRMLLTAAALLGLYALLIHGQWATGRAANVVSDAAWTLAALLAAWRCIITARGETDRYIRRSWHLFAAGAFSWFLGMLWWDYLELVLGTDAPFPTLADYFYDALSVFFLAGTVSLVAKAPMHALARRQAANLAMLVLGLLALSIIVFHAPFSRISIGAEFLVFSIVMPAVYAAACVLLLGCLWIFRERAVRIPLAMMAAAVGIHAAADILYAQAQVGNTYGATHYLNISWLIAFALQYWAAFEQGTGGSRTLAPFEHRFRHLEAVFPAALVCVCVIAIFVLRETISSDVLGMTMLIALAFGLIRAWREWQISLEERRLNSELKETEERFRTMCDATPFMVWLTDADLRCTYLNRSWCRFTGRVLSQELAHNWVQDVHPGDREACMRGYRSGLATRTAFSVEYRIRGSDGRYHWLLDNGMPRYTPDGAFAGYMGHAVEITERKEAEARIQQLALFDTLTGLPNRTLFRGRLERALARAEQHGLEIGVLFVDLDRIKSINDTLGHAAGDQMLREVGRRLSAAIGKHDTVARLGGDEFLIMMPELRASEEVTRLARRILAALATPCEIHGHTLHVTASIGVSIYPRDGRDAETLQKHADVALYKAKEQGRNTYKLFDAAMNAQAHERLLLENGLRQALTRNELLLHYQPQIDLHTRAVVGVEALLRWQHRGSGLMPPAEFIAIAEDTGLIVPIGEWVLRTACRQARAWQAAGLPPLRIAVNVSVRQLKEPSFPGTIAGILTETGVRPELLEVEVTESGIMANPDRSASILREIQEMGVSIAVDDFGTGYSSLAYLKRLPINRLKIDRSFIRDIPGDVDDVAIAQTILAMARQLQLAVVAEGVESGEILQFLQASGCEEAQGYFISRPLSAEACAEFIRGCGQQRTPGTPASLGLISAAAAER
ncbi:MAG: hypothetical protein HONDAALG_00999 [Gammaproteobacteria bacterium]|nr:hypothetical protein [Gammaproteobacteria bacterium]